MPQKKDPYSSPAQKILALYGLLLFTGRKFSLSKLATLLRCSKQTVLRLVEQIERTHSVQVESWNEDNKRWYQVKAPPRLPNVSLTVQQIQNLLLCRDMVLHMLPEPLKDEISDAITRTAALLPDYDDRKRIQPVQVEPIPKGMVDYSSQQGMLENLLQAIRERRVCRVKYRAPRKSAAKSYSIGPLKLITYQDALYITALLIPKPGDKHYQDPLMFAVHRFKSVKITDSRFTADTEACSVDPATFGLLKEGRIKARVRFSPDVADFIAERIWSDGQKITIHKNGTLILNFIAGSEKELVGWVMSFGADAQIVSPKKVKDSLKGVLQEMATMYRQQDI